MVSWENTYRQIREAAPEMAILPIGSVEQHGWHLPVGTDFIVADEVARRLAEELDALLLPAMPYGNSEEHRHFPGTAWLRPATLGQVLRDIVESLAYWEMRRLMIVNSHGGNWILKPTVRELNRTQSAVTVIWTGPGALEGGHGSMDEMHAGQSETSLMLAVRPDLVGDERCDCQPEVSREFYDYVPVEMVTATGVWGRASEASAEEGQQMLGEAIKSMAAYVRDTFARLETMKAESTRPA